MEPTNKQISPDQPKGKYEPWYKDEEFQPCPSCGGSGLYGKNLRGKDEFHHVVDRGNGYFGFDTEHKKAD